MEIKEFSHKLEDKLLYLIYLLTQYFHFALLWSQLQFFMNHKFLIACQQNRLTGALTCIQLCVVPDENFDIYLDWKTLVDRKQKI